jgi:hypothetical protein
MVEKKTAKNKATTKTKTTKVKSSKSKSSKLKNRKSKEESFDDASIVIVEDDMEIDQEKVNEERKAYLEESRSQETSD